MAADVSGRRPLADGGAGYGGALLQARSGFNTSVMLPFEDYDERRFYRWMMPTNWTLCLWCSAFYLAAVYLGRRLMARRERFELRAPLVAWNVTLAVFSVCGAVRMNQELFYVVLHRGLQYSYCVASYGQPPFGFWVVAFSLSKLLELGDTVFIVLRKQPLIFLHWYHHITTLIFTWVAYTERMSSGRWFITMNFTVHAVMYSYYAARALRLHVTRWVSVCITTLQTLQMVVGIAVNVNVVAVKRRGEPCTQSYDNITLALVMYFSYFLLFSWYFYNAYLRPRSKHLAAGLKAKPGQAPVAVPGSGMPAPAVCNGVGSRGASNGFKTRQAGGIGTDAGAANGAVKPRGATRCTKKFN